MSAIRWLNLVVSFPAVKWRGRPALADPLPTYGNPTWPSGARSLADVQSLLPKSDWSNACAPRARLVILTRVRHYPDTGAPAAPLSG